MPTYQYICKNCGHELEELQSFTEPPLAHCPNCNTDSLAKIVGGGGGLIFKGSGFYLTDYKKEAKSHNKGAHKKEKKEEKKEERSEEKKEEKSGEKKKEKPDSSAKD